MSRISKTGAVTQTTVKLPTDSTTAVQTVRAPVNGTLGLKGAEVSKDSQQVIKIGETQVDPNTVKHSAPSKATYHSTLFEAFNLRAVATYNFYTKDETVTFEANASASLDQLPRYVTLTWRPAPRRSVVSQGDKTLKPFMIMTAPMRPVVPFDVARDSAANGHINPGVLSALIKPPPAPEQPPKLDEDAFLSSPKTAGQLASSHVGELTSPFTVKPVVKSDSLRITFVDPSIAGALDPNRIAVATDNIHLTVAGSFSKIVGGLEIISEFNQDLPPKAPPPSFPAPVDAPVVTYQGYVIERHDVSPDGSMRLGRVISVDDVDTGYFVDREVMYGATYAYKIRVVVQWVHPTNIGFEGASSTDRVVKSDEAIGTKVASYYFGDWSDWSRTSVVDTLLPEPPDELDVRPYSRKRLIRVAWKMPNDPQRDIDSFHLLRAVVQEGRVSDWSDLGTFIASNGAYDDHDVSPFEDGGKEYIYAMYSTSTHGERSPLGEQVLARIVSLRIPREHPLVRTAPIGGDPTVHPTLGDARESTEVIARRRVVLYCRGGQSVHPLRDRDYLLDVRSLSTGERVQVNLNVDSTEILPKDA